MVSVVSCRPPGTRTAVLSLRAVISEHVLHALHYSVVPEREEAVDIFHYLHFTMMHQAPDLVVKEAVQAENDS